ncbi:MAG: xanthine dehydrogenase family protein molybdopterin-binding subunit, partial [Acidimicrobiia bacterium]
MATTELPTGSILGHAVKRTEDPRFLTGEARYVEDLDIEGILEAVFLRSPMAHAAISNIDPKEAEGMPGVVAVYTADNLGMKPRTPMRLFPREMARPFLAKDFVRFAGDAIAVVIAETRAQAADAVETILVDYDPLPSVTDPVRAIEPDAPVIYSEHGSNVGAEISFDTDPKILDDSEVVVKQRIINQRVAAVPMEVQACAAQI